MTTIVPGRLGTACKMPASVEAFPSAPSGQKAYSERCTHCSVSLRPMPRPPAVAQRIRERSPGLASRSLRSLEGFSNTSSCAFEARSIGFTGAGSSS